MNKKTETFIKLFNQLEKLLELKTGKYDFESFNTKLNNLCEKFPLYRYFKQDLEQINKIRNAIVHEYIETELAIPSNWTIKKLEEIIQAIKRPPTALAIATPEKNIFSCNLNSLISEVIKKMAKSTYTHVPVIDNGKFIGVFSESSLVTWLGGKAEKGGFILEETKIRDIISFIKPINDFWEFIPRNMNVYEIREKFYQATLEKIGKTFKRLGVLFVTQNGRENEKIIGLVTAWDLQKIKSRNLSECF